MKFCSDTLPVQGTEDFRRKCGGHSQRAKSFAKIKKSRVKIDLKQRSLQTHMEKPYFLLIIN